MSEALTETTDAPRDAPETVVDAVVEQQPTEQPAAETEAPETPQEPAPKPNRGDRRFANLTARAATLEQQLAEAERRAQAAEALIRAGQQDDTPAPAPPVDRDAIRAEVRFEQQRDAVVERGNTAFGPQGFAQHAAALRSLGALGNANFMQALVELPNAEHLIAEFAEDTDALVAILQKPPVAMAAEMGRMAAKLETSSAAPARAALSRAPTPPARVQSPAVNPMPDPYKIKTMEEWKAWSQANMPKRLGGGR